MRTTQVVIFLALALILGVPWVLRPPAESRVELPPDRVLVVVTPHVPQIQREFSRAFEHWHLREHGTQVRLDWRQPGGTSDIMKMLEAHFQAAAKGGAFRWRDGEVDCDVGATAFDVMMGGGSYEFGRLKRGVRVSGEVVPGAAAGDVEIPMSAPAGFDQKTLDEWYGENRVGAGLLYDPQQHWFGTALSGFGIVFNKELFDHLGLPHPDGFDDLADPRLAGWLALADPRQSGSVQTTYDAILSYYGWEDGWRALRSMCGNARYFSNSSPKPPIDVSHGEAAAGLAIDFYGRGQGQAVLLPGQDASESRVGYVDPAGATYVDADPVAMIRGGPNPALARRFIEFCLSEEAQALWQFRALEKNGRANPRAAGNPRGPDGEPMGPRDYELRRMPVRRVMYEKYAGAFIDQIDPFTSASDRQPAGWRSAIPLMMGAFGIDTAHECRDAWRRVIAETDPARRARLAEMYYSWPDTRLPDGRTLAFVPENFRAISDAWKDPAVRSRCEIEYTRFFREAYGRILRDGTQ
jgi:iron(III) transport system substrate-binding protein